MVPLDLVDEILGLKNSSIEEIKDILGKKVDELTGKAEKLRNSSEELRQTARDEFEEAVVRLREQLNKALIEADGQATKAIRANRKANKFREILGVIS